MPSTDTIHIVLASDDAYVQHLGVLLVSIFENNKDESILIHLLADQISNSHKKLLSDVVERRYAQTLLFYDMDKEAYKAFPLREKDHISIASYYRLKLPDLLSNNVAKVLYLDCDMIVTGRLRPLWDTDISSFAVAAVKDNLSFSPETFSRLSIPVEDSYFNAGMLLINMDYWRKDSVFEKALQIAQEKADLLLWHDQDILNILYHGHWKSMPYRWNVMNILMRPYPYYTPELTRQIDYEIKCRVVVHYTTSYKPWIFPCDNPLKFEYYKYLALSPWKEFKPKASLFKRLRWMVHHIRLALGLLKKGYRDIEL